MIYQRLLRPCFDFGAAVVLAEFVGQEDVDCEGGCYGVCVEGLDALEEFLDCLPCLSRGCLSVV